MLFWFPLVACEGVDHNAPMASAIPAATTVPVLTPSATASSLPDPKVTPTLYLSQPTETPSATVLQSPDLDGVVVQFWHPWKGEAELVLEDMVADFNRTNEWGIKVETTAYMGVGALADAVSAALFAGRLPGVLAAYTSQVLRWDVGGNTFADLQLYVSDPLWGLSEGDIQDFYPVFWDTQVVTVPTGQFSQVKRLGVPLHQSALVIFYNLSWSHELGYPDFPTTPAELRLQACAAARFNAKDGNPANDGTGGWLLTTQPAILLGWAAAFGGEISRLDGRGYQLDTPAFSQALGFLKGLQDEGCAWVTESQDTATAFASRQALFYAATLSELSQQVEAFERVGNQDRWTVIPFPSSDGEPSVITDGPSLFVTRGSPREELAAWLVVKWLVSPVNQARWVQSDFYLPTRFSTRAFLGGTGQADKPWAVALDLLTYARPEPVYASWDVVRWVLGDALVAFYAPTLTTEQIPAFLSHLDRLVAEVHNQTR